MDRPTLMSKLANEVKPVQISKPSLMRKLSQIGQPKEMDKLPQLTQLAEKVQPVQMDKPAQMTQMVNSLTRKNEIRSASNDLTCSNSLSGPNRQNVHLKLPNLLK